MLLTLQNFLRNVVKYYDRSIDTLTIFAHGKPGEICLSEDNHLINDDITEQWMGKLKEEFVEEEKIYNLHFFYYYFSCGIYRDIYSSAYI